MPVRKIKIITSLLLSQICMCFTFSLLASEANIPVQDHGEIKEIQNILSSSKRENWEKMISIIKYYRKNSKQNSALNAITLEQFIGKFYDMNLESANIFIKKNNSKIQAQIKLKYPLTENLYHKKMQQDAENKFVFLKKGAKFSGYSQDYRRWISGKFLRINKDQRSILILYKGFGMKIFFHDMEKKDQALFLPKINKEVKEEYVKLQMKNYKEMLDKAEKEIMTFFYIKNGYISCNDKFYAPKDLLLILKGKEAAAIRGYVSLKEEIRQIKTMIKDLSDVEKNWILSLRDHKEHLPYGIAFLSGSVVLNTRDGWNILATNRIETKDNRSESYLKRTLFDNNASRIRKRLNNNRSALKLNSKILMIDTQIVRMPCVCLGKIEFRTDFDKSIYFQGYRECTIKDFVNDSMIKSATRNLSLLKERLKIFRHRLFEREKVLNDWSIYIDPADLENINISFDQVKKIVDEENVPELMDLIKRGFNINKFYYDNKESFTMLMYAAEHGKKKIVRTLINNHVFIDALGKIDYQDSKSPISAFGISILFNQKDIARIFTAHHALINHGRSPFELACFYKLEDDEDFSVKKVIKDWNWLRSVGGDLRYLDWYHDFLPQHLVCELYLAIEANDRFFPLIEYWINAIGWEILREQTWSSELLKCSKDVIKLLITKGVPANVCSELPQK